MKDKSMEQIVSGPGGDALAFPTLPRLEGPPDPRSPARRPLGPVPPAKSPPDPEAAAAKPLLRGFLDGSSES